MTAITDRTTIEEMIRDADSARRSQSGGADANAIYERLVFETIPALIDERERLLIRMRLHPSCPLCGGYR